MAQIGPASHVTLHYRLAVLQSGAEREVISTLDGRPATLAIGGGQIARPLEERLIGLREGESAGFDLSPAQAFGERNPDLLQALSRAVFDAGAGPDANYAAGDVIELNLPDRGRLTGVLKSLDEERVLVDFNHPLAGLPLRFSVQVIGVL